MQRSRSWQPYVEGKNGNKNFRQARIYFFRDKRAVFACNCKFANLTQYNMQYIPCNSAFLAQETMFLTKKKTFFLPFFFLHQVLIILYHSLLFSTNFFLHLHHVPYYCPPFFFSFSTKFLFVENFRSIWNLANLSRTICSCIIFSNITLPFANRPFPIYQTGKKRI